MKAKLKAVGLCCMALALSSFASTSAPATVGGHFVYEHKFGDHALLSGTQNGVATFTLGLYEAQCNVGTYSGTTTGPTNQQFAVTPSYTECKILTPQMFAEITTNGCSYVFKSGTPANGDNTVELACPPGKALEIEYGKEVAAWCTMKVPPQTMTGASYTTTTVGGVHALVVNLTIGNATIHHEGGSGGFGFCINPTKWTFGLHSSITLRATTTDLIPIGLTAT